MQPNFTSDPSVVALSPALERLRAMTKGLVIKTAEGYEAAATMLKSIKGSLATIEDARTRITQPINASLREVNAQAKAAAAPFLADEQTIKRAMIAYSDEQDRLQREEQRRQNEAAAKEQARLQEIADRAAAKGQDTKAEAFQERAQAVTAPIVQREQPKIAGIAIPKIWTFEITDEDLIPREYLIVDESRIRRVVTALKGDTKIPGVRVFEQKRISAGVA
jgi:phosphoenolpyruvate-protein kinase (PTS system EI component)